MMISTELEGWLTLSLIWISSMKYSAYLLNSVIVIFSNIHNQLAISSFIALAQSRSPSLNWLNTAANMISVVAP